ncbi:hypothetical protein G7046_g3475 [Stylonectria norvegica]|nr:hypothetical protein G7046_g3475 [Stylonectria norvegica]
MPAIDPLAERAFGSSCSYGYYYSGGRCVRSGSWYYWGRWVLAAVAIGLFLIVLFSCLAISRRRRRRGVKPMYGTGWMPGNKNGGPPQNGHQMNNYGAPQGNYGGMNPPPPAYGQQQQPQYTGTTFNQNDGYYGNQNQQYSGVQPPQDTYQRDVYQPPTGPPPGK